MENTTTYVAPAPGVKLKLSIMMYFQYMIWGAWLPLLWPFLSEHRHLKPEQIGNMFAAGALGALFAPFIAGQIADRYFPTQKFLGISHILGGILIWQLAAIETYATFLAFSFFYSVVYSPTLPLTNALAFHHIPDRDRDFGKVRAWGTIGWIVAGLTIGQWLAHSHTPENLTKEVERTALVAKEAASKVQAGTEKGPAVEDTVLKKAAEKEKWSAEDKAAVLTAFADSVKAKVDTTPLTKQYEDFVAACVEKLAGASAEAIAAEVKALFNSESDEGKRVDAVFKAVAAKAAAKELRKVQVAGMADAFRLSGMLGIVMGLFCFFLPNTPPSKGTKKFAAGEAFEEITHNPRLIALFLFSIVVSCIHQFYFVHASSYVGLQQSGIADRINSIFGVGGGGLMTLGQMSEFFVLAAIPMVSKTVSRKMLLAGGLVCYGLRMFLFAFTPGIVAATGLPTVAVLMAGIALHGFCFGLYIFVAFMIVDEETTGDVRASAQSLYNLVIVGVGGIVGSLVAGKIAAYATQADNTMDYKTLFGVPMYASIVCLGMLLLLYPKGKAAPAVVHAGVNAEPAEKQA